MRKIVILLVTLVLGALSACTSMESTTPSTLPHTSPIPSPTPIVSPSPSPKPTPTSTVKYALYQLSYLVLDKYPDYFWCDPDFYPVARPGSEQGYALAQFAAIQANNVEFSAILERLNLPNKLDYTDTEKLSIYREHKKLTMALQITALDSSYQFIIRVGQNQGFRITGTISSGGIITENNRETSFNTCPICLSRGTLIDTPNGPVRVEQIETGMIVWTADSAGKPMEAAVIKTSSTPVPASFQVAKITLSNGRSVTASPGHPSADLKPLGDYKVGDVLDGAQVIWVESLNYAAGATYDFLPAGETGLYWANGVLLLSTLK